MSSTIAKRWEEFSGEKKWKGLLDNPLDNEFRRYLIHYGERVEAIDGFFDHDKETSYDYGLPRYTKSELFAKGGLEIANPFKYEVTKYVYAYAENDTNTSTRAGNSKWMGYVAVATDDGVKELGRRDILVAIRGTLTKAEAVLDGFGIENSKYLEKVSAAEIVGMKYEPMVHRGFYSYYTWSKLGSHFSSTSLRDQILAGVREIVDKYKGEKISITTAGHSMGAALATLAAADIAFNGYNKPSNQPDSPGCMVSAFVYACPNVGNNFLGLNEKGFVKAVSVIDNLNILRLINFLDPVPYAPVGFDYAPVGEEFKFNSLTSPYLKDPWNLKTLHDIEVYMHCLAGGHNIGPFPKFHLEVPRDIMLLNKSGDILKDDYKVMANWWVLKTKDMVQQEDGTWKLVDRDVYVPDD